MSLLFSEYNENSQNSVKSLFSVKSYPNIATEMYKKLIAIVGTVTMKILEWRHRIIVATTMFSSKAGVFMSKCTHLAGAKLKSRLPKQNDVGDLDVCVMLNVVLATIFYGK